jgi:Flp pilus assembly protein TadG
MKQSLNRCEANAIQSAAQARPTARTYQRSGAGEDGQSLVETALTLPVLATVILAVFACGILFNNYIQLTNAAGAGADYLQVIRQTSTDPCKDTFTAVANAAPTLNSNDITLKDVLNSTSSTTSSGSTYTGTGSASCSGEQSQLISQAPATVTVSYPAALVIYGRNYFSTGATISQSVTVYEY